MTLNTHERKVRFKGISGGKRLTLQWWKVYLDSCAIYHTFFVREFLKNKLNNDFVLGDDKAPKTVVDAKRVLVDFSVTTAPKRSTKTEETDETGLTFAENQAEQKKKSSVSVVAIKGII